MFENHYECPGCGTAWTDVWSAQCDDDCPACGVRHISPCSSGDVDDEDGADDGVVEAPALPFGFG